jgi:hypothetical protein
VLINEQDAETHKTTGTTRRDHKETRNVQHTDQTSRRRPSEERLKKERNFKKIFKQRTCIQNVCELTEKDYKVA